MIQIENLNFGYAKKEKLFKSLNLNLQKGRIYGLLGKNGSGKTSLIKQMTGLRFPGSGTIRINGFSPQKRLPGFLSGIYLLPEEFDTPRLSLQRFLEINMPFYPYFSMEAFNRYLAEFKVENAGNLYELSYGQKKKILISFGLATNTPVLFADEPTNGLDIPSKSIFRRIMASAISEDKLFLISTHQVKDIEGIIDSILVLDNGKIVFNQSIEAVSEVLSFKKAGSLDEKVLYAEKELIGYQAVIKKSKDEDESMVNLELLFNSIIEPDSKVTALFSKLSN